MTDKDIDIIIKTKITVDDIEYCSPKCQFFDYWTEQTNDRWEDHEQCLLRFNNDDVLDLSTNLIHGRKRTEQCMQRTKASNFYLKRLKKRNNDINHITNAALSEEGVRKVVADVAEFFGLDAKQLTSRCRGQKYVIARKTVVYVLHEYGVPLLQSAHAAGLSDHSTAYVHHKEIKEYADHPILYYFVMSALQHQAVKFIKDYKVKDL